MGRQYDLIPTQQGWLYRAVVMDLHPGGTRRRMIGWSLQPTRERGLVLDALQMALGQRQSSAQLVHHSDRGSQYASSDYQAHLAAASMQCSMSRPGNCFDNAPVESFFTRRVPALQTELVYQQAFATRQAARQAIFEYIEVFYNRQRRHSALSFLTPVEYEARQRASQLVPEVA